MVPRKGLSPGSNKRSKNNNLWPPRIPALYQQNVPASILLVQRELAERLTARPIREGPRGADTISRNNAPLSYDLPRCCRCRRRQVAEMHVVVRAPEADIERIASRGRGHDPRITELSRF